MIIRVIRVKKNTSQTTNTFQITHRRGSAPPFILSILLILSKKNLRAIRAKIRANSPPNHIFQQFPPTKTNKTMSNETNQPTQAPATATASFALIAPVIFGFFIMGFVDVVGIATNNVKVDFNLSPSMAGFLPSAVFVWFLVCSIPTSLLMNKIGRKNTVLVSMAITFVAMLIPLVSYTLPMVMLAFALLGIGNAIIQVSLNPLLTNVVSGAHLTSALNYGQFIKAIASFLGPIIAGFAAAYLGGWKMLFPIFAACTLLSGLWLVVTQIKREIPEGKPSTFGDCFALLGDRAILLFFLGILCVVGVDVGMNVATPGFLMERCALDSITAGYGVSIYFAGRTIGAFVGASLLLKVSPKKFFHVSIGVTIAAMAVMLAMHERMAIQVIVFIIGFAVANIFGIIFGAALQKLPAKANEISGLMIMGVAGGGVFPPLMGKMSSVTGGQAGSIIVLMLCAAYLLFLSFTIKEKKA